MDSMCDAFDVPLAKNAVDAVVVAYAVGVFDFVGLVDGLNEPVVAHVHCCRCDLPLLNRYTIPMSLSLMDFRYVF